jgi:TonB-linked SusC/RagA family outer membrane protein
MKIYISNLGIPRLWLPPKILMIMKLIVIMMTTCLLQVSAASFAQKMTMVRKNAKLAQVLKEITLQTGYEVLYSDQKIDIDKKIDVNFSNTELKDVLEICLKDQNLSFAIEDKVIVIKRKTPSFLDRVVGAFVDITVYGRILDAEGKGIPGATVKVKGTDKSTMTDQNGAFTIKGVDENATIVISYIGFITRELKAEKNMGDIRLEMGSSDLQEVVINKGYYTTTKTLNTGNVSSVTAKDIERQPVSDPMLTLQGRVPGLFIQQNSGIAGRGLTIRLRGQNSLDNGKDPLFIVDGIQFGSTTLSVGSSVQPPAGGESSPFSYFNPADIESIQVLKDADATAIYGSRGANGVILITTKKGKEGKTQIDVNLNSGIGKVVQRVNYMNTEEYLDFRKRAFLNDGVKPGAGDFDLNGTWDQSRYTDWQDVLIGGSAKTTEASVVVSGGSTNTQFRLGSTYRKEGTVYPGNFALKRAAFQFNINHKSANDKFNITLSSVFTNTVNDLPTSGLSQNINQSITLAPNAPNPFNPDGTLNWENSSWSNPLAPFKATSDEIAKNLVSNLIMNYRIFTGFQIKSIFSYSLTNFEQTNLTPKSAQNPDFFPINKHDFLTNKVESWNIEPQITYNSEFLGGNIEGLIGTTLQSTNSNYLGISGSQFSSDALLANIRAASTFTVLARSNAEYRYTAVYSRLGYSYQNKYVVNITARRDGSSRFGPRNKFGNFGAIGAAWIFSNENFFKENVPWLSLAKLRSSYGTTGNDQLGEYKYLDTYSVLNGNYQGIGSLVPTQLTNPFYGWERVNKLEASLELGFVNNRITLNASVYRNRTKNQLVQYGLPSVAGFSNVRQNLPAVIENRGLELDMSSINIKTKDFDWTSSINITFPRNELVSYPNFQASSYTNRYAVGKPLSLAFLYHYTGLNPQTGLYTFQDINADGQLTSTFDYQANFVGQRFYGGLQNNFKFHRFEFDFLIQFTKQNGYAYYATSPGRFNSGLSNLVADKNNRGLIQSLSQLSSSTYSTFRSSDGQLADASFIRLKNVSFSWRIPYGNTVQKFLKSASIYLQGQNLYTFTKYKGFDPEVQGSTSAVLAPLRTVTAGLRASF